MSRLLRCHLQVRRQAREAPPRPRAEPRAGAPCGCTASILEGSPLRTGPQGASPTLSVPNLTELLRGGRRGW